MGGKNANLSLLILEPAQGQNDKSDLARLVLQRRPMRRELLKAHVSPRTHGEI